MHDPPLPTRLFRALSRLAPMNTGEVVRRFRQEVRKRTEARSFAVGVDPTRHEVRPRQQERPKFFFDREDVPRRLTLLRERVPEQVKDIVETADRICRHRFDVLGYKDLSYGDDIDWHLDPVHGKRAPTELWFKVPYLDFETVGDAKIIWELNRHQHLVALAKAYRLTDDQRYASELVKQWNDWQEKNPYPRGINWASSLEVAFRSMSWLWVEQLLGSTPALTAEFRELWLRAMARSGRHIASYLSTYFSPNTHLIGEAAALFFIGT